MQDSLAADVGDQKYQATGSGAVSETLTVDKVTKVHAIRFHLSAAGATAENLVVSIDSDDGTAYDTVLFSNDMNGSSDYYNDSEVNLRAGDDLKVTYTNTDGRTWGLEILYGDV